MEIGKENEGETEKLASNSLVSSAVLCEDIVDLQDFIERLKNEEDQIVLDTDQTEKLKFLLACLQLCYYMSDGPNVEMSCISFEVHDLIQSLFNQSSGDDMMVKLKDHVIPRLLENITSSKIADHHHSESSATMTEDQLVELLDVLLVNLHNLPKVHAELIFPSMTQYELLQNAFGNLRDFYALKVNGCVEYETIEYVLPQFQLMAKIVGHFCFVLLSNQLDKTNETYDMMNNVLGRLIKQLLEASPDLLTEYLIHLQERVINAITPSTSARNIHVVIEFLFIILYDVSKDIIHHDKLFLLLEVVEALIEEVTILVCNLEEKTTSEDNMNVTSCAGLNLLENSELLKEDLKNVFLKARADSSQLCFPMSDGPLFMTFLLTNLKDLVDSNASSVALIEEEIKKVKEDLEIIRSFFGYAEQELHRDLWTRVLDVAYEAEHAYLHNS
ncbi:hypothetical protein KY290_026948 [Solanum tuberosum]|uniref:Uncharacterized protein n=1 Tax=Solanum tuberosum TaxID=4113 RepID=A0ABQ7UXX0_SOLTU|nr:hypothetical protein KY290_026948 [Solanum tuberosum]